MGLLGPRSQGSFTTIWLMVPSEADSVAGFSGVSRWGGGVIRSVTGILAAPNYHNFVGEVSA